MLKIVGFVKRRKGLTREEFKKYWLENHSKLEQQNVQRFPVRRIVASFATGEQLPGKYGGDKELPFDGMVELYFASYEDMLAHIKGPAREKMKEDERNFVDLSEEPIFVVTEEYLMAEKTPRKVEL